eukprot:Nitzschia sp. Nitz4//scaffold222_size33694//28809//29941//NITZ4_007866-RA/size33694-augustus-gene-0.16-mRNA-1//1//CDS//3329542603//3321//frame0
MTPIAHFTFVGPRMQLTTWTMIALTTAATRICSPTGAFSTRFLVTFSRALPRAISATCPPFLTTSTIAGASLGSCPVAQVSPFASSSTARFSTLSELDEDQPSTAETPSSRTWDLKGLQKQVSKHTVRCHKKIGKLHQNATETSDNEELSTVQERLRSLNQLEVLLADWKGRRHSNVTLPPHMEDLVLALNLSDEPNHRHKESTSKKSRNKGPKKMKAFRRPYRRYYTEDNIEIRVGKQAHDNDALTLSSEHRDDSNWWMHAAGCPGSHVIIRTSSPSLSSEVIQDAAALAARQSKCSGSVINVSLTRAGDIIKPPGAHPGTVQLIGNVKTIKVNMKQAQERLGRLDATVLVN